MSTPTRAYLALETASFFFCRRFFSSHHLNISKNLWPVTIAEVWTWADHNTFWIPSIAQIIRRGILEGRVATNPVMIALHLQGPKSNLYMLSSSE